MPHQEQEILQFRQFYNLDLQISWNISAGASLLWKGRRGPDDPLQFARILSIAVQPPLWRTA